MIYYEDKQIKIRDICDQDIIRLFYWSVDKELRKFDPKPLPTNSKELVAECQIYCNMFDEEVMNEETDKRKYKYFIIADKDNMAIGFVNFFDVDREKKQGELGVMLGDMRYWHKGIASKSVSIALNYIFENMDINRVIIETGENNKLALKLFTNLNFKRCGEVEDEDFKFIMMEKCLK